MNQLIIELLLSFIATACFGVIFNAPTRVIPYCGIVGAICWGTYYMLTNWSSVDIIQATFISSFLVAVIAHLLARFKKLPVIIFSVSGIIPLVPGGTAYNTMRNIVEQDYVTGMQNGMLVFMISGAIAMGLVFAEVIMQIIVRSMRNGRTSIDSFIKSKATKFNRTKFKEK